MAPRSKQSQQTADGTVTPTPDGNGPELEGTPSGDGKPAAFDWGTLAAPHAMANKTSPGSIKVDVIKTVPEGIRQRAESSLTINVERVKAVANSNAKRPRIDYHWDLQPVPDKDTGEQFVKLITKYAKYRPADTEIPHAGPNAPKGQVTARCGNVGSFRKDGGGDYVACDEKAEGAFTGVRYSVRPFEQRATTGRLPGSA